MSNDTEPPPNAEPRKRRRLPPGEKVRYAARYAALRQRVDTAVRLLNKAGATPADQSATIAALVKVAIETLTEE